MDKNPEISSDILIRASCVQKRMSILAEGVKTQLFSLMWAEEPGDSQFYSYVDC